MARQPRPDLPDVPQHIVQRGNNRGTCFFEDGHRLFYLGLLAEALRTHLIDLHAYVLMTNHVHLLATARQPGSLSAFMHSIGQRYAQWFNERCNRTGSLYEGRFKSGLVRSDRHLLCCYRYIEDNPVRAGMVAHPADYRWSSYRCNALGEVNTLITPHPTFLGLDEALEQRQARYRDFVAEGVPDEEREAIRRHLSRGAGRPPKKKGPDPF
jgi:putative transposase